MRRVIASREAAKRSRTRWLRALRALAMTVAASTAWSAPPVQLYALRCEHLENPIGIGRTVPRLSWKLRSERRGEMQTAYAVRASSSRALLTAGRFDLWDSGKVASDQSVLVPWAGRALDSRSQVVWQVRVWDKDGRPSAWSDAATFELGLLHPEQEWRAKWITADLPRHDLVGTALARASWISAGSAANQAAAVRAVVDLPADAVVRRADLTAVADGRATLYVNGHPTRHGSTSRTAPLQVAMGEWLRLGRNVLAIGSAAVREAIRPDKGETGRNAIVAHGTIELEGGRQITIDTDTTWKAAVAPEGEWFAPAFDDSAWPMASSHGLHADAPSRYVDTTMGPGRYLQKRFVAREPVARARLYATAMGVYEASVNGARVGDARLDPGWTDYAKRVMVQTFDVTAKVRAGENVLGAVLSDGWYAGRVGWMGLAQYGPRPAFAAQLELTYTSGATETIATDDTWEGGSGPVVAADAQWGEIVDARRAEGTGGWAGAVVQEHKVSLDPQRGPPIRAVLERGPQSITRRGPAFLIDFGQNLVGHVRLIAGGPAGTTITVRHAEMLDPGGGLYTENLRTALSTDTFILAGASGRETFEPRFTFHGFRYAEVSGYPGELQPADIRAVAVASDTPPAGKWESSHAGLNRLYENIVWGQRSNFLSVPTDCPQRDERMGWTGDAQVFAATAVRAADVAGFFTKWLVDLDDAQPERGDFPNFAPRVAAPQPGWPVWGDAGVLLPWILFTTYGDDAFLADHYPAMARWVDYNQSRARDFILAGGVGDHLAPARTPVEVVATAYFAHSARLVAKMAARLGRADDAARYGKLGDDIAAAFRSAFVGGDGVIKGDTQTAYLLALQFDLLPDAQRPAAAQRLAALVEKDGHLTTGFVGVGLIAPVLSRIGRSDLAWRLVLSEDYPSWLFSVKNGATTIWERWDGWTPDLGFQDSSMNSFNHYALGSVGVWLFSGAAGIELDEAHPGYKRFVLRPQVTDRLSYVKATQETPYGTIVSHWRREGDRIVYDVVVPPNSRARLDLPGMQQDLEPGAHRWTFRP